MTDTLTTADKIAMIFGGGFVLFGIAVMGLFEVLVGNPHTMEQTNEAGDVIAHTTFDPTLRATLIAIGLLIWGLYVVYKLVAAPPAGASGGARQPETAD